MFQKLRMLKAEMNAKVNETRQINFVNFNYFDVLRVLFGKSNYHIFEIEKYVENDVEKSAKIKGMMTYTVIQKQGEKFIFAFDLETNKIDLITLKI